MQNFKYTQNAILAVSVWPPRYIRRDTGLKIARVATICHRQYLYCLLYAAVSNFLKVEGFEVDYTRKIHQNTTYFALLSMPLGAIA